MTVLATPALAQGDAAGPATNSAPNAANPRPFNELTVAAQRLRDATHQLVRERASAQRSEDIQKIDRTLAEVQSAMLSLPPNLLLANANASPSQKAADDLARAADRLHETVSSLSADGNPDRNQQTISEIRKALASVQQERMNLQQNNEAANNASAPEATPSHEARSLPAELKQKMQTAGYTNVEIVPGSYLVSAKDKDGKNVMMKIGPNSMTMLTQVPSEGGTTSGQGSSQSK
jgi:hypothetical protein